LKGDLEAVVLKALRKAPEERYQSIGAFTSDVTNYLANLPVSARCGSIWYRSRRFVTRNKWQVAAASVTLSAIIIGGATALWQARMVAVQRDRAITLASRNASINEFMSMLVAEAASSEKPVTVSEMIARSEQLAVAGGGGNHEDRAAILETIAMLHYYTTGDVGKAAQLLQRALTLVRHSHDSGLRSRLTCFHAMVIADMGEVDAAARAVHRELGNLKSDHESASACLTELAFITHRAGGAAEDVLRYATLALDQFHQAATQAPAEEGELLGAIAYGHSLKGDTVQANHYFERALRQYTEAGRERSPAAILVLHNWAVVSTGAGVPKRAMELYDRVLSNVTESDPDSRPSPAFMCNKGRALEEIGRYAEAKDSYELGRQLSERSKNTMLQVSCTLGLASVSQKSGDRLMATRYLNEGLAVLGSSLSAYAPLMARRALIQGRLDLADGKLNAARAQFDWVLGRHNKNDASIGAALGKAEVELLAGSTSAAVTNARIALDLSTSLQGGGPYSNFSGLSWLMLGRALQARGEIESARKAFESAVTHLSNTVDADHLALLRAREFSGSADLPGKSTFVETKRESNGARSFSHLPRG
jgi:non-specific serine/threonine protein kinase/serine/threonine-protein kinase